VFLLRETTRTTALAGVLRSKTTLALPFKAEHMLTLAKLKLARPGNRVNFKGMIINLANSKKQSRESEGKLLTRALRKRALAYKRAWREKQKSFKLC